ncbi:MAG: hypothetical protein GY859_41065 [Desulfobacterales bacterium]|nr:hypothetical protein [Desulfobacterales bacterium]
MDDTRILPVEEMVQYEEFSDRVEILRYLVRWVKNIGRMASMSTAIIAPRRMGKTVLLERLVNTVFFKPEYRVAPFYLKMKREKITLRDFLLLYARTFFRQYIAYCEQDPLLYSDAAVSLEHLASRETTHKAVRMAQEHIQSFIERYNAESSEQARIHWEDFIGVPERLGSHSGTRVAVIIDEFQDMKFFVHNVSAEKFEDMKAQGLLTPERGGVDLTATYNRKAQSRKAPMLVCGSAVTLVFRTVMGGPLGGRFDFIYLKPLSIPDGATLLHNVVKMYAPDQTITPELAMYASAQTGGHPYYLYCLAVSRCEGKSFADQGAIDRLIQYEIESGKIRGFWQTHFDNNRKYINADDDLELGKKIIYYFTQYNDQSVDIDAISAKIGVPAHAVERKIEKLREADLVDRIGPKFYAFNDICLMRFIKFMYERDLKDVERVDLSQQNLFNTLKGEFLEMVIQVTMMKFNHETLPGVWFGARGEVEVPLFDLVKTKMVKGAKTPAYEIDLLGKEHGRDRVWLCECKYTQTKMGLGLVEKLERAAEAFRREEEESGREAQEIQFWIVSTGGFTKEVLERVASREDLYASDHDGINGIFREFGGNYEIPVFEKDV